jgi:glycosyltransferase involved in cell wall biosynthesis
MNMRTVNGEDVSSAELHTAAAVTRAAKLVGLPEQYVGFRAWRAYTLLRALWRTWRRVGRASVAVPPSGEVRVCMLLERSERLAQDARVRRELRALGRAGYRLVLIHAGDTRSESPPSLDGALLRGVGGRGGLLARVPSRLHRAVSWARFARVAASARPAVVHAHDVTMLAPAWLAAKAAGAKLVYDTHEYAAGVPYRSPWARRAVWLLERLLIPRCAAVIAVSDAVAERVQRDRGLPRRPAVVRNVPELDWGPGPYRDAPVTDLRRDLRLDDSPLVLHQGAAEPGRGCERLIEAVASLDGVHLLFLGDCAPGFHAVLASATDRCGARDRVHFRPSVRPEALLAHTRQADVGACLLDPSCLNHRLTLQNKLFEYIAAGLPVVATRDTEFGRLVDDLGVGWTASVHDPAALAAAIAQALDARDDPGLRERLTAAARALNWETEQSRLLAVYEGL